MPPYESEDDIGNGRLGQRSDARYQFPSDGRCIRRLGEMNEEYEVNKIDEYGWFLI
jgi:hypothetical protein